MGEASNRPCEDVAMRWVVTLSARRRDVERLATELPDEVAADPENPSRLLLTLIDPEGDAVDRAGRQAAKAVIDSAVERLNGLGKLRWGRAFEGVAVSESRSFDATGHETLHGFVGPAVEHMLPEDFADMIERMGHPRPEPPRGWEMIKALDLASVAALTETNSYVRRALYLLELSLRGDEFDWVTAYAAVEVVEDGMRADGLDWRALGWWSATERGKFTATANRRLAIAPATERGQGLKRPE